MEKYIVEGMTCAACQARVEKAVSKVDGVQSVSYTHLDVYKRQMLVHHEDGIEQLIGFEKIQKFVDK